jgi:hypothetical protein
MWRQYGAPHADATIEFHPGDLASAMRDIRKAHAAAWLVVAFSLGGTAISLAAGAAAPTPVNEDGSPPPIQISGEVRGAQRFVRPMPGGLRFALAPLSEGDKGGWAISVFGADTSQDFVGIATPPYHGPNEHVIEAWHFRTRRTAGADSGNVNAPGTERGFYFVTSAADYEAYKTALEKLLWPAGLTDAEVDSIQTAMDQIPTGEGLLTIRAMSLDGLGPGETPWFEKMRFDVVLKPPRKDAESLKPADKPADKSGG